MGVAATVLRSVAGIGAAIKAFFRASNPASFRASNPAAVERRTEGTAVETEGVATSQIPGSRGSQSGRVDYLCRPR